MSVIKKDFVSILFGHSLLSAGVGGGGATFGGPLGRKSPTQAFDVTFGGRTLLWELYGIFLYIKLFFS